MRRYRIVVAAHGRLATELVASAALICGAIDDCQAVELDSADSPESFRDKLVAALDGAGTTRPVLLLTDLAGGTPHNVAMAVGRALPAAVLISGVNLPILIEAVSSIESLDAESVERLVEGGREAVRDLRAFLASRPG